MRFSISFPLLLVALPAPFTSLVAGASNSSSSAPLLPSQDSFYTAPFTAWYSSPPGTVLKSRNVTISANATSLGYAYQLQFRTTNLAGHPAIGVTTVLVPNKANASRVLSYQNAYDSPNNDCSPSYGLQRGASAQADSAVTELLAVNAILAQGVIVSVPDYEGVNAAFLAGPQTAFTLLDSIRAVIGSGGADCGAQVTLAGYSGGAYASEWAAEYAASYAPDLAANLVGMAIGGLPVNFTKAIVANNGGVEAGLVFAGIIGVARAIPSVAQYVNSHLKLQNSSRFALPAYECARSTRDAAYGYVVGLAGASIGDFFDNADSIVADNRKTLEAVGTMGRHGVPQFPMLIWKGTADETVPDIADTDALVDKFCAFGASVQYYRVVNGTHAGSAVPGYVRALSFLQTIYSGGAVPTSCNRYNISTGNM